MCAPGNGLLVSATTGETHENFISFRSHAKMKMHQLRSRLTRFLETRTHHPGVDVVFAHRVKKSHSNLHAHSIAIPEFDMNLRNFYASQNNL